MGEVFNHNGYTFEKIKSNNKQRPFRVKCIETLEEKESGCSYEDAADLISSPLEFAKNAHILNSQDINYIQKTFEQVLIGKKKSECDYYVENDILNMNLIEGNIYYFNDTEKFAKYKIYKTEYFKIEVRFERGLQCGATKIVVSRN